MKISKLFWKNNKIDYLLLINDKNRQWFSNFFSSFGFILISFKENKSFYFLDDRYFYEAKKKVKNCTIFKLKEFTDHWKKITGTVGCDEKTTWLNMLQLQKINNNAKLKIVSVQELRLIKTAEEIEKITRICQITANVWENIKSKFTEKMTEIEAKMLIIQSFAQKNIGEMAFQPIVSSGKNSAFIHTIAQEKKISSHLLCDFGGQYQGYNSDFTRIVIFGKNKLIEKNWSLVKEIQKKIISQIRPGEKIANLAKLTKKFYQENGIDEKHAIGHGVGLEVHELPNISLNSSLVLQPGMILTVEPGIYDPKIGGVRVEDVVLVTKNGCKILTLPNMKIKY